MQIHFFTVLKKSRIRHYFQVISPFKKIPPDIGISKKWSISPERHLGSIFPTPTTVEISIEKKNQTTWRQEFFYWGCLVFPRVQRIRRNQKFFTFF